MARCDRKHAKGTRFPTFETREIAEHYQNLRSVITYDLIHGSDFFFFDSRTFEVENKASIKPAHSHINQRDVKETGARPASRFYKWAERRASVDNETKERKGNNVGCKVQCARAGREMRFFFIRRKR